jgi:UDP-N-acetylglucosamine acyltransferase
VDPAASLGVRVTIGPFCVVGPEVELEDDVTLHAHVVVGGRSRIGAGTTVFPFASLGEAPQHLGYKGEPSRLVVGRGNVIREHVTMNTGTVGGQMETSVGSNGYFMVGVHIAHDCRVGDNVIMANQATLGGHVEIGDNVVIGGLSAVHQFVRVGSFAMLGGASALAKDLIPFGLAAGNRAVLYGLNLVGLKRRGFSREQIAALRGAYRQLFNGDVGSLGARLDEIGAEWLDDPNVQALVGFVRSDARRPLCRPRNRAEDQSGDV